MPYSFNSTPSWGGGGGAGAGDGSDDPSKAWMLQYGASYMPSVNPTAQTTGAGTGTKYYGSTDPWSYGESISQTQSNDVQHPRPGGTALSNNAMGEVGSWGDVPSLTKLWDNSGSFNSGLWNDWLDYNGGSIPGAFGGGGVGNGQPRSSSSGGSSGAGSALGSALGGGMGGFNLGSMMSGMQGLMGGMGGGGGGSSSSGSGSQSQQPAPAPPPDKPTPQRYYAGAYTPDQQQAMGNAGSLIEGTHAKNMADLANAKKNAANPTYEQEKAERVKSAQARAEQTGGQYDSQGNYYAPEDVAKLVAEENAKREKLDQDQYKTPDSAVQMTGLPGYKGMDAAADSGSGSSPGSGSGGGAGDDSQGGQDWSSWLSGLANQASQWFGGGGGGWF